MMGGARTVQGGARTEKGDALTGSLDHCLEMLRQSVMCVPDTSLTTFTWTSSQKKPVLDIRRLERQCIDWEVFMASVITRVVDKEEVERLTNPLFST